MNLLKKIFLLYTEASKKCTGDDEMHEETAVRALKSGDMSGLETLYALYAKPALRMAYLIVSDYQTAEDILQDAFIQCLRSIKTLKDNNAFRPWFYKIVTRLSYKAAGKSKQTVPCEDIYGDISVTDRYPSDTSYIYDCIKTLGAKHRAVIVMYFYADMSIKEISSALGCPQGTVKSRLNAATKLLKERMEGEYVYG